MEKFFSFQKCSATELDKLEAMQLLLRGVKTPFSPGANVAIKLHWGEIGNKHFLSPVYAREIVRWLKGLNFKPFIVDTTVLYSGGRRDGAESLRTAAKHGFTEDYLGCPVSIGDGLDGKSIVDIPAGYKHFSSVQTGKVVEQAEGFVIFSHFKGHMEAGFGGAIKNISMGLASRAQKQRMHADVKPQLNEKKCILCGECAEVCPTGAAVMEDGNFPTYDLIKCIGCAQCIAMCPETALRIMWETDFNVFQEKLVETAAAIWRLIRNKTIVINALIDIVTECDCLPGSHPLISGDKGFIAAYHPVIADAEAIKIIGSAAIDKAHPNLPWQRQFSYAREIGFI
ncbi:MAG TPA: DUF362 domain-containing protein [Smithellaceae bacterium]|nr:DUF362 domain-containing protein [Smithellaceae bacterium]